MSITCDPNDPRLGRGVDDAPRPQNEVYLVDCGEGEFAEPVRRSYIHTTCKTLTTMGLAIAETYARNPKFYGATYCVGCQMHKPVAEFRWADERGLATSIVVGETTEEHHARIAAELRESGVEPAWKCDRTCCADRPSATA